MAPVIESIKKELLVEASQETAFRVFTEKMDLWWPRSHHVGSSLMKELMVEPREKGRWYSKHEDGSEVDIGHVLVWNPYGQLVLAWQVNGNFHYDPTIISEVEVRFVTEGPRRTRVLLEHRDLEKLGGGLKVIGDMDRGWGMILDLYKNTANSQS